MDYEVMLVEKNVIIAQLNDKHIDAENRYIELLKKQNEIQYHHNQVLNESTQLKKLLLGSQRERFIAETNPTK